MSKEGINPIFAICILLLVAMVIFVYTKEGEMNKQAVLDAFNIGENKIYYYEDPLPKELENYRYEGLIEEAIKYWNEENGAIFVRVNDSYESDVRVRWIKEFAGDEIGYAHTGNLVEIGFGDSKCDDEWKLYTYDSVLKIAKHEFGHILGFEHNESKDSIMYPITLPEYSVLVNEKEVLSPGYSKYFPSCVRNFGYYYVNFNSDQPIHFGVSEENDFYDAVNRDRGEFLNSGCGYSYNNHSEMDYFGGECQLSNNSGFFIINNNDLSVRYTLKVSNNEN